MHIGLINIELIGARKDREHLQSCNRKTTHRPSNKSAKHGDKCPVQQKKLSPAGNTFATTQTISFSSHLERINFIPLIVTPR